MSKGGILVFDDINQYPHMEKLDEYICENGFTKKYVGNVKISYVKE